MKVFVKQAIYIYICKTYNIYIYRLKPPQDVLDDVEIQNFAHEMAHEAFGWEDGNFRGMPEKIETKQKLVCNKIVYINLYNVLNSLS